MVLQGSKTQQLAKMENMNSDMISSTGKYCQAEMNTEIPIITNGKFLGVWR